MMKQYETFELSWQGPVLTEDYAAIDLEAVFTQGETGVKVKGFYDGDGVYKVRFLPMEAGAWQWTVRGLITDAGEAECAPAESHGPVYAKGTAFQYADGTPFHPFGTTVYALAHQDDALIEQTMQTLAGAPFNKIRMCVFPKHYDFNHNDPTYYAFEKDAHGEWDPTRPCIPFWHALEKHIARLDGMGIQVDLILFHPYDRWGFNGMGAEKDKTYLDYLLRRLSACPNVWWSLANEYELCKRTEEEWFAVEGFIAENDPYHHLLSCHNIFKLWDATRPLTTHASIQGKNLFRLPEWIKQYQKPVMIDECCYEGNLEHFWGSITGKEMVRRFWQTVSTGAYCTHGETFYSDDEVLWWARGGKLKGESAPRIAFCRQVIEGLPGHLEPDNGWLSQLATLAQLSPEEQEKMIARAPEMAQFMIRAFLNGGQNAIDQSRIEFGWFGHICEDVFLHYHDTRPTARDTLKLPEGKTYRVEVLDTWNMTRETVAQGVSGEYVVQLPGREYMAVLATVEK